MALLYLFGRRGNGSIEMLDITCPVLPSKQVAESELPYHTAGVHGKQPSALGKAYLSYNWESCWGEDVKWGGQTFYPSKTPPNN